MKAVQRPPHTANTASESKRRLALKALGGSALAGTLANKLPAQWQHPLVQSAVLPAHAQTSPDGNEIRMVLTLPNRGGLRSFSFPYQLTRSSGGRISRILFPNTLTRPATAPPPAPAPVPAVATSPAPAPATTAATVAGLLDTLFPAAHAQTTDTELRLMRDLALDFSANRSPVQTGMLQFVYDGNPCDFGITITLTEDRTAIYQITHPVHRITCGNFSVRASFGTDSGFGTLAPDSAPATPAPQAPGPVETPAPAGQTTAAPGETAEPGATAAPGATVAPTTPEPTAVEPTTTAGPVSFSYSGTIGGNAVTGSFTLRADAPTNGPIDETHLAIHTLRSENGLGALQFEIDLVGGTLMIGQGLSSGNADDIANIAAFTVDRHDFQYTIGANTFLAPRTDVPQTADFSVALRATRTGGNSYGLQYYTGSAFPAEWELILGPSTNQTAADLNTITVSPASGSAVPPPPQLPDMTTQAQGSRTFTYAFTRAGSDAIGGTWTVAGSFTTTAADGTTIDETSASVTAHTMTVTLTGANNPSHNETYTVDVLNNKSTTSGGTENTTDREPDFQYVVGENKFVENNTSINTVAGHPVRLGGGAVALLYNSTFGGSWCIELFSNPSTTLSLTGFDGDGTVLGVVITPPA